MNVEVKISFQLAQTGDGYPPVSVESLWAREVSGFYIIDSIPFFTSEATLGDIVYAKKDGEDSLWFEQIVTPSSNSLVRVVFFDVAVVDRLVSFFLTLGCGVEQMREFSLLAISIPVDVELSEVQRVLVAEAAKGLIDFEEPLLRQ